LQLGQHGETARNMKSANHDRHPRRPQRTRNVQGARKLVGLDPDEGNHAEAAMAAELCEKRAGLYAFANLIDHAHVDLDVRSKSFAQTRVPREAVDDGEAVGGNERASPTDHIAVVVIVRRLAILNLAAKTGQVVTGTGRGTPAIGLTKGSVRDWGSI